MEKDFLDKWNYLNKKRAYPYEYFNNIDDYEKLIDNLKKEDFLSELKNKCPGDEETERTKEIIKFFDNENGEELTEEYFKSSVILLAEVFEKLIKVSINEYDINVQYCVSLLGYI